jgi:hypothetical protein
MPREEEQQVETRRLAKDIRALEQRASVFDVRSTHNILPAAIYRSFLRGGPTLATCAVFDGTAPACSTITLPSPRRPGCTTAVVTGKGATSRRTADP